MPLTDEAPVALGVVIITLFKDSNIGGNDMERLSGFYGSAQAAFTKSVMGKIS